MDNVELKPCPLCGKSVELRGGDIDWRPSFYDPDSGGDEPYYINCDCGLGFCIGCRDLDKFFKIWNGSKKREKRKNSKSKIIFAILMVVLVILLYGFSWIFTCGIIKLITLCFGLSFKWSFATGLWLIICILRSIFKTTVNQKKE